MINSGIGKSFNKDAFKAGAEAAKEALEKAGGKADLAIVFSSVNYDQEQMLSGVQSVTKEIPMAGCSDAGEICNDEPLSKNVVVMALGADKVKFTIGAENKIKSDSKMAGNNLAKNVQANSKDPLSLLMIFSDGLSSDGTVLLRGIQEVLGVSFPIVGGSAGDDLMFKKTYQYFNGKVLTDSIVGVGFSGNFSWGLGVMHGWEPIGIPMKVSKSKGRRLKKLGSEPAIKIYKDYFGEKSKELSGGPLSRISYTYPLGIAVKGSSDFLLRNVSDVDENGELLCSGEIEEGSDIRLMISSKENVINAARIAAEGARMRFKGVKIKATFVFDCVARYKFLGSREEEEIVAIRSVLGKDNPLIGFYAYGAQASLGGRICKQKICRSEFHNETVAILVLGE